MWLVMSSLPFGVVSEAKAPDPAVPSTLIFPITTVGAIGPARQNILERLETCPTLIAFRVPAADPLGHRGAVIPEQERRGPSPQHQHRK